MELDCSETKIDPCVTFFKSDEYKRRRFSVCLYCSFVEKVLTLLTTGSEDCYYTGIVKDRQ